MKQILGTTSVKRELLHNMHSVVTVQVTTCSQEQFGAVGLDRYQRNLNLNVLKIPEESES